MQVVFKFRQFLSTFLKSSLLNTVVFSWSNTADIFSVCHKMFITVSISNGLYADPEVVLGLWQSALHPWMCIMSQGTGKQNLGHKTQVIGIYHIFWVAGASYYSKWKLHSQFLGLFCASNHPQPTLHSSLARFLKNTITKEIAQQNKKWPI